MPLTDDQAKNIKEQILKQVETFPEDKRQSIKEYILSLNNEQLEEFLIKNKMMSQEGEINEQEENSEDKPEKPKSGNQCIMCMISNKQIESLVIYEDKDYLAALEINPYSQGHTMLIPKIHLKETKQLKSKAFTIANRIGRHLVSKLGAENFQITSSDDLKHALINIIPRYKDQKVSFERKPADKKQLSELFSKIGKIEQKKKIQKIKTEKSEKKENSQEAKSEKPKSTFPQMNRRIP